MNEQMTAVRTPQLLGAEIRNLTATAKYMTLWYAVEIGRRLTEAKELVKHGEWMDFLERETEFSSSSASRFMTVFREYGGGEKLNFPTLGNISVSNALRLLAVPEEERETFAETVDAAHISTKELEAAIKERDAAKKKLAEVAGAFDQSQEALENAKTALMEIKQEMSETSELLEKKTDEYAALSSAAKEYRDRAEEAEQRVKELERRPIDVAVQEPDPAEIERRAKEIAAEERQKAEEKIRAAAEKAKAEQEKLREKLKAAEEKLAAAGAEDKAETERLRGEIESLKKQLAMSDAATVIFKLRFTEWQEAFKAAMAALVRLPEGTKEKCRGAILAQLDNWKEAV